MKKLLYCALYLAASGIAVFLLGRKIPKRLFSPDQKLYREFAFEQNGKFYNRLHISKWKDRLPDMSKIVPKLMPGRGIPTGVDSQKTELLIRETCVAELAHLLLAILGFGCMIIWRGTPGAVIAVLYALGNLPFIMVQRYNRIRLGNIYERFKQRECRAAAN